MRLRDVSDGYESDVHWVSEIGQVFVLIDENYPREKIDLYVEWIRNRDKLADINCELYDMQDPGSEGMDD